MLAKNYPNNRANDFLDWFTYSDNTIDGQSRKNEAAEDARGPQGTGLNERLTFLPVIRLYVVWKRANFST